MNVAFIKKVTLIFALVSYVSFFLYVRLNITNFAPAY